MSLLQEGAVVKIYDPKVTKEQIYSDIRENCEPHEYESKWIVLYIIYINLKLFIK